MRVALFGGSFNPPHYGHVLAAHYALMRYGVDEVWVLPVLDHPYDKDLAPFEQRLDWCRRAFEHLHSVQVKDSGAT